MMNFALTLTADRDDARDLIQETSLRALSNQSKFVENTNFLGWIMTIMRNLFINNYHKVVRCQTVVDQDIDFYSLDVTNNPNLEGADSSCHLQEITDAIDALSDDLKLPFSMYLSGYKYHEIADALQIPIGTVKSRIFFARQELKKRLKDFR